ncbi:MAG: patatin-like phospholipase family protein [Ignavibacteriaceae bacterium]
MTKYLSVFFVLLLFIQPVLSQEKIQKISLEFKIDKHIFGLPLKTPVAKPKLGLALSGGGSRGLAQIGVLKALVENGIDIDLIAGTSMGSIVGGLYSLGYSISEIDSIARNTDWGSLITVENIVNRRELFIDQKVTSDKAIITFRLNNLMPVIPTGINDGIRLSNYLSLLALQAPLKNVTSFDSLETVFGAVCANLENGDLVLLRSGSMSLALRASSSVSFLLSPVKLDSMTLVDGGLVANIPVKVAKEMGSDLIIAVNTTSTLYSQETLEETPWVVPDQVLSIPMKLLNEDQLKHSSFAITPDLSGVIFSDFTKIDTSIDIGYKTTIPFIDQIKKSLDSLFYNNLQKDEKYLKNLSFENSSEIGSEFISKYKTKDSLSTAEIKFDLYKLNKNPIYSEVFASIEEKDGISHFKFETIKNPIITEVVINGDGILDTTYLQNIKVKLVGTPFESRHIISAVKEIMAQYRNKGLSLAELKEVAFNDGTLVLDFNTGRVSGIIISNNKITNETVLRREFPIREGDLFSFSAVQEGLTNLRNTNLFESVILTVEKDSSGNILNLIVDEKHPALLRVGFRVDNENRGQLSLDLRNENLFGSGTELGLFLMFSGMGKSYRLEHKSVRVWNTYFTYNINGFYRITDALSYKNDVQTSDRFFSRSVDGEYRQIYYGLSVQAGTQISRFGNFILSATYGKDEVKNIRESTILPFEAKILSLRASLSIDTQDKYPYPKEGIKFTSYYETAQSILGAELGYTDLNFEFTGYFSLNETHTLSSSFRLGFADKTQPLSRQYSLGGQYSFFGMRENEMRGRQVFKTSFEYRALLPVKLFFNTYFHFRYDLGSMWTIQEEIRFSDLKHGLGATLSLDTPIGPTDFALGRSFVFTKNLAENPISFGPLHFYFSIGYYF